MQEKTLEKPQRRKAEDTSGNFINYIAYKVNAQWRFLEDVSREAAILQAADLVNDYQKNMVIKTYSTLGLREDADFLLRIITRELPPMQDFVSALYKTHLGKYLNMTHSYLAVTRESAYTKDHQHDDNFTPTYKEDYLFVYPFVKTRDWYLLPFPERKRIMDEHIKIGHGFPNVKINTSYSFGMDDQDFVVAFDTESPRDFVSLVMKLRETESSKYTLRDTPMLTGIKKEFKDILESLG